MAKKKEGTVGSSSRRPAAEVAKSVKERKAAQLKRQRQAAGERAVADKSTRISPEEQAKRLKKYQDNNKKDGKETGPKGESLTKKKASPKKESEPKKEAPKKSTPKKSSRKKETAATAMTTKRASTIAGKAEEGPKGRKSVAKVKSSTPMSVKDARDAKKNARKGAKAKRKEAKKSNSVKAARKDMRSVRKSAKTKKKVDRINKKTEKYRSFMEKS